MILRVVFFLAPFLLTAATPRSYSVKTIAGTSFVGDGAAATGAILSQPEGIAVDPAGNIFVADADDNRVRKFSPGGVIQTVAGTGVAGFSGDQGPATEAQLNRPYGLALDSIGNLYIADLGNARLRKMSAAGTIQTVAGGGQTSPEAATPGTTALQMKLNEPRNVAIDRAGNVYLSDFGANRVYEMTSSGTLVVFAGTGTPGFSGDGSAAKLAQLSAPAGLSVDAFGNVFIADSGNNCIRQVSQGAINTAGFVTAPTGLAINAAGSLYIAAAGYFGTLAQPLLAGLSANDVAVDANGNLYLTSDFFVRRVAPDGSIASIAGSGASRYYGGDGGPAASARLQEPSDILLDDLGNGYIADTANNRIRKISMDGSISTFAGTGAAGSGDGNGVAMLAQFNGPRGLGIDSFRNIYVADSGNNRICMITQTGALLVVAGFLDDPEALAVDKSGAVYVADTGSGRLLKLAADGPSTILSGLSKPAALAFDLAGALYFSEARQISKLNSNGTASIVAAGLNIPGGIAPMSNGDLLVAETGSNRVLQVSNGSFTVIAGTGIAGFSGDAGSSLNAQFNGPSGIALDLLGNVWIADTGNQRIRLLKPADSGAPQMQPGDITVVNAASLVMGPVAPGEIITIYGSGFDPAQTQVFFDGQAATLFYTGITQINALVPALNPGAATQLSIMVDGAVLVQQSLAVSEVAPALFASTSGAGQSATLNEDGSYNSSANPAARGSIVSLYATGWSDSSTLVDVTIGTYHAAVLYAGPAPGFLGLMQINAQIPGGFLAPGSQPLALLVATVSSQPGVTIALK